MNPVKKRQRLADEQAEQLFAELDSTQEKIEVLDQEENNKVIEITKHYNQQRNPHLAKRTEVISKVPDFWLTAFHNHPILGGLLVDEDFEIFKALLSLEVIEAEDVKSGFKISLTFKKNPFFTNKTLTKEYAYDEEGQLKITASQIHWKKGKDPTGGKEELPKGGKRMASEIESLSFFCWFGEEEDDELAEVIRTDFWPNPVKYYHNLVEIPEEADDDDDDDDDDDEDAEEGGEEGAEGEEGEEGGAEEEEEAEK